MLAAGFAVAAGLPAFGSGATAAATMPSLVVVITVDQFRADYLARFRPHFEPGGFRLLLEQGAQFTDCRYQHAITKTACGHAVILSGVHANVSGIIANDWLDRETLRRVNCVDDDAVEILGLPASRAVTRIPGGAVTGRSPRGFLATTVTDELKLTRGGRSKVVAVSSKDRSAILLGGKLADAAYWMDKGRIVTSTYYMKSLPDWVSAFNAEDRVDSFFGKTWDRLLPAAAYDAVQGPDAATGEADVFGMGITFPKKLTGGAPQIGTDYYEAFENSPFKSEVLVEFAQRLVEKENLGRRGVTDVFCLSFSANDTVGHNYGPDSHEVMDITLRTDRMLAKLLAFLDRHVGLKNCTIVFTSDHGIPPVPERLKAQNAQLDAGRIDNPRLLTLCEAALNRAFGPLAEGKRWLVADACWLLFVPEVLQEKKIDRAAAQAVVRDAALTSEFVLEASTRTELEQGRARGDFAAATLLSFHRERSGDVYYQAKPFWVERTAGTNHGTPYTYDVHVPLIWFGVGVKPGVHTQRVGVDDIAPTLAHLLDLPAPPMSQGHVLFR